MQAKSKKKLYIVLIAFFVIMSAKEALSYSYRTYTTYVYETQERRYSTRFTLTEWMRIKERMKMMDLWLAIFSNPKDKDGGFKPELNVIYGTHTGTFNVTGDDTFDGELKGKYFKGQFWLTNIISGTTGIKTLNIDIGAEGYMRLSDDALTALSGAQDPTTTTGSLTGNIAARYYSANFRLFGKNIQDSSLVAKFGTYEVDNTLFLNQLPQYVPETKGGSFTGGELQFYLTKNLGVEGNYQQYAEANTVEGANTISGEYYDYNAYIEVSLLRVMFGKYSETWRASDTNGNYTVEGEGYTTGLKIQF